MVPFKIKSLGFQKRQYYLFCDYPSLLNFLGHFLLQERYMRLSNNVLQDQTYGAGRLNLRLIETLRWCS